MKPLKQWFGLRCLLGHCGGRLVDLPRANDLCWQCSGCTKRVYNRLTPIKTWRPQPAENEYQFVGTYEQRAIYGYSTLTGIEPSFWIENN